MSDTEEIVKLGLTSSKQKKRKNGDQCDGVWDVDGNRRKPIRSPARPFPRNQEPNPSTFPVSSESQPYCHSRCPNHSHLNFQPPIEAKKSVSFAEPETIERPSATDGKESWGDVIPPRVKEMTPPAFRVMRIDVVERTSSPATSFFVGFLLS